MYFGPKHSLVNFFWASMKTEMPRTDCFLWYTGIKRIFPKKCFSLKIMLEMLQMTWAFNIFHKKWLIIEEKKYLKFYHQGARIYKAFKTDKNGVLRPLLILAPGGKISNNIFPQFLVHTNAIYWKPRSFEALQAWFSSWNFFLGNIRLIPAYHKKRSALGISVFLPAQKNFTREPLGPKYKA